MANLHLFQVLTIVFIFQSKRGGEEQRQKLREQILSQQSSSNQQDHLNQLQIPSQNVSVTKTSSGHKFRALNSVYGTAKYTKRNI